MINQEIIASLKQIGLTEGEIKVYLALASLHTSSVTKIVEKSEVSMSKIYLILNKLMEKGLVSSIVEKRVKKYTATEPEMILKYLDEEKRKIDSQKESISAIIPFIKNIEKKEYNTSFAEIFRGIKGAKTAYKELIYLAREESSYLVVAGKQVSSKLQPIWQEMSEEAARKKINQIFFYEYNAWYKNDKRILENRKKRKLYYPKIFGKEFFSFPNITIIDKNVLISELNEYEEIITIIIRDPAIAMSFFRLFKMFDKISDVPEGFQKYSGDSLNPLT